MWFASGGLVVYVALVLTVTLTPSPVDRPFRHDLDRLIEKLHRHGLPGSIGYDQIEFLSNVAMFVPIGFIAALLLPRRSWWLVLFAGPLFSGAIELAQLAFLPERHATLSDVLANSAGALVGAICAVLLRLVVAWRDRLVVEQAMRQLSQPMSRPLQ